MRIDHLLYTVPDVEEGMERVSELLRVEPVRGGRHPNLGTANALIGLGPDIYLEIIGPDPESTDLDQREFLGMDFSTARLGTWVAKAALENAALENAAGRCLPTVFGQVRPGQRDAPDGSRLSWLFSDPFEPRFDGVVPFLIDWTDTPHPGWTLVSDCRLIELHLEHPTPRLVEQSIGRFEGGVQVTHSRRPGLRAEIATPRGVVNLT